jgi:hypothetical protein
LLLDSSAPIAGYYDSPWPAECGGPRRQKIPRSPGFGLNGRQRLHQITRRNGEWNVMMVQRAPGEIYLQSNNHIDAAEPYGKVELIDAESLETVRSSPKLPSGGHTWCGGIVAHANGYLYFNNGDRCYKLDPECHVVSERKLPRDSAYNSLLIMADGRLVMKNIERDADRASMLVVLDADTLDQIGPETAIPENSMGRIAMDTDAHGQTVYVPGSHHFYRYRYVGGTLRRDAGWAPRYRTLADDEQSFAWDSCLSGGGCWFLDNGDNEANVAIFSTRPFGRATPARGSVFRGLASSPQKLIRVDVSDAGKIDVLVPFGLARGSIFSPPAVDPARRIAIAFDTGNGRIGAFRHGDAGFETLWTRPCRVSMQMVLFIDTGEVVVNDFRDGRDEIVAFDIESGDERGRVATESATANGMFLSTGWKRDVMYCSIGSIARIWAD